MCRDFSFSFFTWKHSIMCAIDCKCEAQVDHFSGMLLFRSALSNMHLFIYGIFIPTFLQGVANMASLLFHPPYSPAVGSDYPKVAQRVSWSSGNLNSGLPFFVKPKFPLLQCKEFSTSIPFLYLFFCSVLCSSLPKLKFIFFQFGRIYPAPHRSNQTAFLSH